MPIVSYSPYEDAANLGQGVGNSLSQMALQLPQIRMQQLQQQALLKKLPYELALDAAQTTAEQARAGQYKANTEATTTMLPERVKKMQADTGTSEARGRYYDAQAGYEKNRMQVLPKDSVGIDQSGQMHTGNLFVNPQQQVFQPQGGPGSTMSMIAQNTNQPTRAGASGKVTEKDTFLQAAKLLESGNASSPDEAMSMAQRMATAAQGGGASGFNAIPPVQQGGQAPVKVGTKAERDKLPKGAQYIGPDGVLATKQ